MTWTIILIYGRRREKTCLRAYATDATALPAKSDSGVMLCLQSYQDLESIDHLCIYPIRRIGLIHKWSIDKR